MSDNPIPIVTIAAIKEAVCRQFDVTHLALVSQRRSRAIARPRQIAMYLAREFTKLSLPAIGRHFERDHTTVIWGCRRISELIDGGDVELIRALGEIRQELLYPDQGSLPLADAAQ